MAFLSACAFFAALLCASAKTQDSCTVPSSMTSDQWQQHQHSNQILLALRSSANTGVFSEEVLEHLVEYQAWSTQHQKALFNVEKSKTLLDQVATGQSAASSPCASSLPSVKQGVSSLVHDLRSVSDQVSTHVRVLEVETGKLNSTVAAFENVDEEFSRGISECSLKREQAARNLSTYSAQLAKLKKIAMPSTPYTHTGKVEWPPVAPSLLEDGLWSKQHCLAFVNFTQQYHEHAPKGTHVTDCDANREELHKACSAVYISVRALVKEAKQQSQSKACDQLVRRKKNEQLLPLVTERKQQVSHIRFSSEKLGAVEPVLKHLNDRVNKLGDAVAESVQPHCDASTADITAKTLSHMHELIHSLQDCPSHNDIIDNLPEVEGPQHVAYTVCSGDGDCGTEELMHHNATLLASNPVHVEAIMSWGGELQ